MSEFVTKSVAQEKRAQKIETRTAVARMAALPLSRSAAEESVDARGSRQPHAFEHAIASCSASEGASITYWGTPPSLYLSTRGEITAKTLKSQLWHSLEVHDPIRFPRFTTVG